MTNPLNPSPLLAPLISSAAMRAILSDRARLERMLDFLVALARAEAAVAVIPALALDVIADAAKVDRYDPIAIGEAAADAGDVGTALIEALAAEVSKSDAEAALYVNWGASCKDVIDTALMLDLRAGIDALVDDLNSAIEALTTVAGRHRRTAVVARTALQHALPMPFGLKIAGYAAALARSRERLRRVRKEAVALQFGGNAGTLAALGEHGLEITDRMAAILDLPAPLAPWHGHGDRLAEIASMLAILAGTCGKIARDIALLMQPEVAEASASPLQNFSGPSAIPHEHRRAAVSNGLAAATLAPNLLAAVIAGQAQEHEGSVGASQGQWQTVPALLLTTSGALGSVVAISQSLDVDAERMRNNLDMGRGLIMAEAVSMALGAKLGMRQARSIVEEACRKAAETKLHLNSILADDPRVTAHMTPGELARLFELMGYQGVAQTFIDRLIGSLAPRAIKRS
jgi:3-carboxy-cis,cis-muconate cycloisomerase